MPKARKKLDEQQAKAVKILSQNLYMPGDQNYNGAVTKAAKAVGVTRQTVHNWLKYDYFREALEKFKADLDDCAFKGLRSLLRGDGPKGADGSTVRWWLALRNPDVFDSAQRTMAFKQKLDIELEKLRAEHNQIAMQNLPQIIINTSAQSPEVPPELIPYMKEKPDIEV